MSEAYERERQNNARLEELSSKVTALRGVTVDIYDNARSQEMIDDTVRSPAPSSRRETALLTIARSPSSPTHFPPCPRR